MCDGDSENEFGMLRGGGGYLWAEVKESKVQVDKKKIIPDSP